MDFLNYTFVTNAIIIGAFTAIATCLLGNFMVVARQAVMSDMLSHAAIAGVGLGVFWNISPLIGAFLTSATATIILWSLSKSKNQAPEAISGVLLNGSLALALLLVHIDTDNVISLEAYLFGSILTISQTEFHLFIALNIMIIAAVVLFWDKFLTLVFDKEFLYSRTKHNKIFEIIFMLLISAIVGIGLKVVGGLLIGSMLIIPTLTVQHYCNSFKSNVAMSIIVNIIAVISGIIGSFHFDVPTSSAIIMTHLFLFAITKIHQSLSRNH